ncbi:3,9-dihydroxypterocarpan 6A-monooxygenase-like [Rutidosis leptorrhynchoides]|uniref:3,9-dihydroxypterocarpan 6A-monooxygenase-like n=1 Tax=Rutidosis leptorrhynchoides TaxID=125765 RepID=UPI003A992879
MADFQGYLFFFIIWLISTILLRLFLKSNRAKHNLPPIPFKLPIIGHLHLLAPIPHQAFYKISLRYGPIFRIFLGSVPCVVACSPETAKEFLKTYENAYLDRPQNSAVDYLTYGSKDFSFAPYGSYWKFMKKIVMSQLLNGTTLDLLLPVRQNEIKHFIKSLSQKAEAKKAVHLEGELVKMSNNVISRMLMGERCSEDENDAGDIKKLVTEIAEITGKFNLSDYIWIFKNLDVQGFGKKLKEIRRKFDALIEKVMKEHEVTRAQNSVKVKDLLHILLDVAEDKNAEIKLTRENIKAFILDIFAAGTDTSAITIEWALAELINHPNIMQKAVEEIDKVVGKNRLLKESDIQNLPYLQAIVKETLRLHSTGPMILRQSTEDCTVAGYHIPANTTVFVNVWALGRDPNHWDKPLEFKPERFEENNLDVRGQHFHMLPFGSGRRMCPGTSLALQVIQTTLGAMIQCFEWKAGKDGKLKSVDMDEGVGITLPRANPLVCIPVARFDPLPLLM